MANPVFPVDLAPLQDSKYYAVEPENVALKSPMDGGYVVSRARHTRLPRLTYATGFTDMTYAQYVELRDFFRTTVKGSSVIFDWVDPVSQGTTSVRFVDGSLSFKYTGVGTTTRFDVQFKLEEA